MKLLDSLSKSKFAFAAFLIPLSIRAIPEILVGPYPVGWDTIAFYVPNTLDWAAGKAGIAEIIGTAPLMYMISVPVYLLSRINPVWIFKIMGPVLYGSTILALFGFLRQGLKWKNRDAVGAALFTSIYFVTLRISWDLYRNMLGLAFLLVAMAYLRSPKSLRNQVIIALSIIGAVSADQLTGTLALVLIGSRALEELLKGNKTISKNLVQALAPGLVLFFSILYADLSILGNSLGLQQSSNPNLQGIVDSLGFLGLAYLPLLPLVALGIRRVSNLELRSWSFFCAAASLTALLPLPGLNVSAYRWSLLLSIPLCVFAAAGLSRLVSMRPNMALGKLLHAGILPVISSFMLISAILYIALPAQLAMPYYAVYPSLLPTSMVQDTVPVSEMGHLHDLLVLVNERSGPGTVLITHQAVYGWARAYNGSEPIVNYKYSSPLEGVRIARQLGYSSILMIWWVQGSGLHGQSTVPSGFFAISTMGNLAEYEYR